MERTKYDVFISYSRKDYVKDDVEIPGNPITAIMDCFDRNDVKYWVDKKGIYHGQEFIEVIADAIANSKMLVFVSSVHSNESIYTAGEILEALDGKKAVIPVKIDDSPYSKKFRIPLRPLDYIDYKAQPNTAVPELLRTVNKEKERIRRIEEQQSEELLNEKKKQEIAAGVKEFQRLNGEQDFLRRSLYSKSKDVGAKTKKCPVCDTEMIVDVPYCESCGWGFASLYGVYGVDGKSLHDEKQLRIVRGLWQDLKDGKDCKKRIEEIAAILEEERKMKEKYEEQSCNLERTAYSLEKEKRAQQERLNSMQSELHETTDKLNKTQRDLFESKKLYGDAIKNNHELEKRANSFEQQYKEMKVRKEEAEHIVVERENELEKVRKEKDDILNQLTTAKNGIAELEKIMKGIAPAIIMSSLSSSLSLSLNKYLNDKQKTTIPQNNSKKRNSILEFEWHQLVQESKINRQESIFGENLVKDTIDINKLISSLNDMNVSVDIDKILDCRTIRELKNLLIA